MDLLQCVVIFLLGLSIQGVPDPQKSKAAYQKCPIDSNQATFDVLPGTGWDNLDNQGKGRILDLNFSKCLFSNDNRFLIPNQLQLTPKKISNLDLFSETFTHFTNYTSMTSKSVNIEAKGTTHGATIGGSFSYENSQVKSDQLQSKSMITRVQLRYNVFKSMFEPDTPLYPTFRNRIFDIAGLILENKDTLYPAYLADMIIRDYGTHVIRSVDAGAILAKTDTLNSEYVKKYQADSSSIGASASASFGNLFSISSKFQTKSSNEQTNEYNKQCQKTHVDTMGGTLFGANFSLDRWTDSVMNNLVPIDRRGDPIYYVLTPRALPELDDETVNKLYVLIKDAVQRYYSRNTIKGCMNFLSPNFNSDANVDAGNCKSAEVNFTLGGTYQTCSGRLDQCSGVSAVNPLTGSYSCPTGFSSVALHNGLNMCRDYCHSVWVFWKKCYTECSYFKTFWCSPKALGTNLNGYQFGGIRSVSKPDCPLGYIPLKVGLNAILCVTSDSDPNNPFAIRFGGFYSCSAGNPLAQYFVKNKKTQIESSKMMDLTYWSKSCAEGYVSHIASMDRGCQISYCTETNKFSLGAFPELQRPPFIELNYNPNSTKVTIFANFKGQLLMKDKFGSWKLEDIQKKYTANLIGGIIGCILCISLLCVVLTLVQRRHYERKIRRMHINNSVNEENMINYGALNNEDS